MLSGKQAIIKHLQILNQTHKNTSIRGNGAKVLVKLGYVCTKVGKKNTSVLAKAIELFFNICLDKIEMKPEFYLPST